MTTDMIDEWDLTLGSGRQVSHKLMVYVSEYP